MSSKSKNTYNLTAKIEQFDSFWDTPDDVEKGYDRFYKYYYHNYLKYIPAKQGACILVISCGPGYFVNMLTKHGYTNVLGIDSYPEKIEYALAKKLNCKTAHAFDFLNNNKIRFDVIVAEQEINHLTKSEIFTFLELCRNNLNEGGVLIIHSLNGSNPITAADAIAQNFDHYNIFNEYSLRQVLEYCSFSKITIIPLNLYVFYANPLNYIAIVWNFLNTLFFRLNFMLYGKPSKIFTKKIAAICKK